MKVTIKISRLLLACLILSACATAPTYRSNPKFTERIKSTKKIAVVPLKTDVFQVTAGGVQEKMDVWCSQAKRNVMTAIQDELSTRSLIFVKPFEEKSLSEDQKFTFEETRALFDAVNYSIIIHTYGPSDQLFADKVKNFNYSLGPEVKQLVQDTDALLLVSCSDQIATEGRKALQAGSVILGALVGVQVTPLLGITSVSIALVDANTGSILWYNYHGSPGDHDLRDPVNTTKLIKELLRDFPIL